jgi:hypothetical protein
MGMERRHATWTYSIDSFFEFDNEDTTKFEVYGEIRSLEGVVSEKKSGVENIVGPVLKTLGSCKDKETLFVITGNFCLIFFMCVTQNLALF